MADITPTASLSGALTPGVSITGKMAIPEKAYFQGPPGEKGDRGEPGSSIQSIAKTGTNGLEDTYTITLTDGSTSTFTVTNGNGIASVVLQSGTHAPGTTDTYKITFTNGEYTTFSVYNGLNGAGTVVTVNGKDPDASGNVALTGGDVPMSAEDDTTLASAIAAKFAPAGNAGAHNAIYRGKNLGSAVTAAQWAAIGAGTFEDLFIGDYWEINNVIWRIAAFDYYFNQGYPSCTTHHVTVVPDAALYQTPMNSTKSTAGGYVGSTMYTAGLEQAKTMIGSAFGTDHILSHRQALTNAVKDGKPSGTSWYDSTVELMTERNVFGCSFYGIGNDGATIPALMSIDTTQFPLFAHDRALINPYSEWVGLRDIVSAANYARVSARGAADYTSDITGQTDVRPAFSIKA